MEGWLRVAKAKPLNIGLEGKVSSEFGRLEAVVSHIWCMLTPYLLKKTCIFERR